MAKPITQKAKSPLKQVESAGEIAMRKKSKTPDQTIAGTTTETYKYTGALDSGVYDALNKEMSSGFASRKYGYAGNDVKEYEKIKLGKMDPSLVEKTVTKTPDTVIPGEEKIEDKPLYTVDKSTNLSPYEDYQNRLIRKRARRDVKREARQDLNALAKDYAAETADEGNIVGRFLSNQKQKRDYKKGIAEGMSADEVKQARDLRKTKRGASASQVGELSEVREASARASDALSQGASRGDQVVSNPRIANQTDYGDKEVTDQMSNMEGKAVAKMRYEQNVGIKQRTPLKKGYFK